MTKPLALEEGSGQEQRLIEALRAGAPIVVACQYAGVHRDTYYEAVKRRPALKETADQARASAAIRNLALVQKYAVENEDWRAAAEALKLMMPEHFNYMRQRVEVSGPAAEDGSAQPVRVSIAPDVDADFVAQVLHALAEGPTAPKQL